jgi:hypothetical protein
MEFLGKQLTDTVLMIRPVDFRFNTETAADNEFQHEGDLSTEQIAQNAVVEFDGAVQQLRKAGVNVVVLNYSPGTEPTPDAVFPNNWISLHQNGDILLYPMYAQNRRLETKRFSDVVHLLEHEGLRIKSHTDLTSLAQTGKYLEGTGSIIFDHLNKIMYASLSVRTDSSILETAREFLGYNEIVLFHSASSNGKEIYHTNVILSIGLRHAIICSAAIPDDAECKAVMASLSRHREVIDISLEQTEKYFCGNTLQLINKAGIPIIVMSMNAYHGFTDEQLVTLRGHGEIVPIAIPTIEHIGGGSARCMIAEVFLPRK